jgi:hypothetical protein
MFDGKHIPLTEENILWAQTQEATLKKEVKKAEMSVDHKTW